MKEYYLHERDEYVKQEHKGFLVSDRGSRMTGSTMNKRLKELLTRTSIDKNVTLHGLRHTIANHLLEVMEVEWVQKLLGHVSLDTTLIYTQGKEYQV